MELNETGEQCALREMLEETGLKATRARLLGASASRSRDKGGVLVLGYIVDVWEGDLKPDSDVSDLRFCAARDAAHAFEAHRELLALYDELFP